MEVFANNPTTTLNGAINNSVTSLTVTSASSFPSGGNFRILIDSEILRVTAVSGTTFTVTRGAEGTSAASHSSLAAITGVLTRDALANFRADGFTSGTYSSLPAAGNAGVRYLATDTGAIFYDNGTVWVPAGPPVEQWTIPNWTSFAWSNQGTTTISTTAGKTVFTAGTAIATYSVSIPNASLYSITARVGYQDAGAISGPIFGIFIGDGTKLAVIAIGDNGSKYVNVDKYTSVSVFSASYKATVLTRLAALPTWFQITDDGTTRTFNYGYDGVNWTTLTTNLHADFLTPSVYGIVIGGVSTSKPIGQVYSLALT